MTTRINDTGSVSILNDSGDEVGIINCTEVDGKRKWSVDVGNLTTEHIKTIIEALSTKISKDKSMC
jgi:hypothetical protein